MRYTPLYEWHIKNNAKIVEFHNWAMPIYYDSVIKEHLAVRENAGVFDISHMGRIRINGPDRLQFINCIMTNDIEKVPDNYLQYSMICNEQGGILDDVTIYRAYDYLLVITNACNTEGILLWLMRYKDEFNVTVEDKTDSLSMVSIQGPNAEEVLQKLCNLNLSLVQYHHFDIGRIGDVKSLISRSGYTGEDGFELIFGTVYVEELWMSLLNAGEKYQIKPVGLGARDTLRIEACIPSYGNELDTNITPLEADLKWVVAFKKKKFVGIDALVATSNSEFERRLIAFEMIDKTIPRNGYRIFKKDNLIGKVTSGTYSPILEKNIGMGYIERYYAQIGNQINIEIRETLHKAVIVEKPFVKHRSKK